jgi:hypothetical protein
MWLMESIVMTEKFLGTLHQHRWAAVEREHPKTIRF